MVDIDLTFQIKRGVINEDDIDDKSVQKAISSAKKLCREKKFDEAVNLLMPYISFEWDWNNGDADPSEIFYEPEPIGFDCNKKNCLLQVGLSDNHLMITATTTFTVKARNDVEIDADIITNWLYDNSMYVCGYFSGGWSYHETDGDNVWVKRINNKDVT